VIANRSPQCEPFREENQSRMAPRDRFSPSYLFSACGREKSFNNLSANRRQFMSTTVLLVDDDPLMHRLYRPHLERAGFRVLSANSGIEAVELAEKDVPDIIVMDIMMPQLDGLSAIREIKQDARRQAIPVIVVTSNPQYHLSQKESQWAGANRFLTKPFGPAALLKAIQELLPAQSNSAEQAPGNPQPGI